MSAVENSSCECVKSELDLFQKPQVQLGIEKGMWVETYPQNQIGDTNPIEFFISGSESLYIDLNSSYLKLTAEIVKGNGEPLDAGTDISVCNLTLHSLFSQVDIFLNQTLITSSTPTYPYRAIIETLLSYDAGAKDTQLQGAMFYKDTAGKMEMNGINGNVGYAIRGAMLKNKTELVGRIHADIFHQPKYMLNRVDMHIKLVRAQPAFYMLGAGDYKVKISSACFVTRKTQILPSLRIAHERALTRSPAQYNIKRVLTNVFSLAQGSMNFVKDNLFSGQMPSRLTLAMVDSRSFNGDAQKNAFNFQHFGLTNATLYANDEPVIAMTANFDQGCYMTPYIHLFHAAHSFGLNEGNNIDREEFAKGYTLLSFDLTPDLSENLGVNRRAILRLELVFAQALPQTAAIIVYGEFSNVISCSKNRVISLNYSV